MTTAKDNQAGAGKQPHTGTTEGEQTREELEVELNAARSRAEDLENENKRLHASARRTRRGAEHIEDVVANIEGEGRVGRMFRKMGSATAMAAGAAAGALLGVGGTLLIQKRMNRTAVGSGAGEDTTVVFTQE
jgi:hypothetical protein